MTSVLAIDQSSTNNGWTFGSTSLDLKAWTTGKFRVPKRPEIGERLIIMEDTLLELIDRFDPDLLVHEKPFDPTWSEAKADHAGKPVRRQFNRKTMQLLQKVEGVVLMAAARRGLAVEAYEARSWQATLNLPKVAYDPSDANAKKKLVRQAVRMMGANVETFDEADSWGICYHALHGKPGMERAQHDLFERAREAMR